MKTNPHAPTCKNNTNMFSDAGFWVPASSNISLMVTKWQTQWKEGRKWLNKCSLGCGMQFFTVSWGWWFQYQILPVFFFCSWYPKAAQTEIVNTTQMVSGLQKEAQGFCLAAFLHDVIRRQVESRQTKLRVCYWLVLCYHLSQFQLPVVATSFPITLAMSTVVHSQAIEENSVAGRMLCAHIAQLTSVRQSKQFKHARHHHWFSVGFCASRDTQLTLAHNATHSFTHPFSL